MSEILPADPSRRGSGSSSYSGSGSGSGSGSDSDETEVGFARTTAGTAAMLARYLLGRAIIDRISLALMAIGLGILALAVVLWIWVAHWLAILVAVIALLVLAFRALVIGLVKRLMGVGRLGPAEDRIRALVGDTGGDLRRELKRIGLPSTAFGLPLLAVRLMGRRRRATLAKLADFELGRVVPRSRMDELQFVVRNDVLRRPGA